MLSLCSLLLALVSMVPHEVYDNEYIYIFIMPRAKSMIRTALGRGFASQAHERKEKNAMTGMRSLCFFMPLAALALAAPQPSALAAANYHYDQKTGACVNAAGQRGHNVYDVPTLLKAAWRDNKTYQDVNLECADLSLVDFSSMLGLNYPSLQRWNLRGAKLKGCRLHFADLADVDLAGANLKDLDFGYVTITGIIDAFSVWPASCTKVAEKRISCRQ